MDHGVKPKLALTALTVAISASGCSLVADLDRFESSEIFVDINDAKDVDRLDTTTPIVPEESRFDLSFVSLEDAALHTRMVLDGLRNDSDNDETNYFGRSFPGVVLPDHRYMATIFVDRNADGIFDEASSEFAWTATVDNHYVDLELSGDPITADQIPTGGRRDFRFRITEFTPHDADGQQIELIVIDTEANRMVGYYRNPEIPDVTLDMTIHGIIDPGRDYEVQFYADYNKDQSFTPGADHSWTLDYEPDADGLMTFKHVFRTDELSFF
jgi:hypothetical protein